MPKRAPRICPHCQEAYTPPKCPCRRTANQQYEAQRGTPRKRGYTKKWEKARAAFLRQNVLCAEHRRQGHNVVATVVDHIVPHRGDMRLFWDRSNWQALCETCHNAKTARGE